MSHHFSSELVKDKPQLNLSDLYVFPSERPGHTVSIMCSTRKASPARRTACTMRGSTAFTSPTGAPWRRE